MNIPCEACGLRSAATVLNLSLCVMCARLVDNEEDLRAHEVAMAGGIHDVNEVVFAVRYSPPVDG